MKNDQKNETNPNMSSMFMLHPSNISNLQLLLSKQLEGIVIPELENISEYFPAASYIRNKAR